MNTQPTPGPWYVGAQNDQLYITAGRAPSPDNDYPMHDALRVVIAKVYEGQDGDVLPVDLTANAVLLANAWAMSRQLAYLVGLADEAMKRANASGAHYHAESALKEAKRLLKATNTPENDPTPFV